MRRFVSSGGSASGVELVILRCGGGATMQHGDGPRAETLGPLPISRYELRQRVSGRRLCAGSTSVNGTEKVPLGPVNSTRCSPAPSEAKTSNVMLALPLASAVTVPNPEGSRAASRRPARQERTGHTEGRRTWADVRTGSDVALGNQSTEARSVGNRLTRNGRLRGSRRLGSTVGEVPLIESDKVARTVRVFEPNLLQVTYRT